MNLAKNGDNVKVHYSGRLNDGSTFDSSEGKDPLEFTIGTGQVIAGFENGVIGMIVGDKKTVNIPAVDAYGDFHDTMVIEVPKEQMPPDLNPVIGDRLTLNQAGQQFMVIVTKISDTTITIDANHPLAGKDLIFDLELVSIG